jgi:DNA replication protein DnaC
MTPIERLQTALNGLGLKAVEARLESLLEQASKQEPSYADFLDELLSCEVDARRSRYLRARLQLAHLPFLKNFDHFDSVQRRVMWSASTTMAVRGLVVV